MSASDSFSSEVLSLSVCGCAVLIHCGDAHARELLMAGYGSMLVPNCVTPAEIIYSIQRDGFSGALGITREGASEQLVAQDAADFLFLFEKDLTIELQRKRSDLFFIHAAVVELHGMAVVLAAPSGTGKSTLTWALLGSGFGYLSDELAPVNPATLTVYPYPHALCLKSEPPPKWRLPADVLRTRSTIHVSTGNLGGKTWTRPLQLSALFFLQRTVRAEETVLRQMQAAEGAARIYSNSLNALAHPGDGLEVATRIAEAAPCYELKNSDLGRACDAIRDTLAQLRTNPAPKHEALENR